jgi:hypothetical protein
MFLNGVKMLDHLSGKFLSLVLLVIAISFFLINKEQNESSEQQELATEVSKPLISTSNNKPLLPLEFSSKNTGKILSIQHGGGYSFIEVELPSKKSLILAAADLPNKLLVGNDIHWKNSRVAKNYYSHALKQNFEQLYMVTINDDSIKSGMVLSIRREGENTFLNVAYSGQNEHTTQELIIKTDLILGQFLEGAKIEWQLETLSSNRNKHRKNNNLFSQSPVMVDWIRISRN